MQLFNEAVEALEDFLLASVTPELARAFVRNSPGKAAEDALFGLFAEYVVYNYSKELQAYRYISIIQQENTKMTGALDQLYIGLLHAAQCLAVVHCVTFLFNPNTFPADKHNILCFSFVVHCCALCMLAFCLRV